MNSLQSIHEIWVDMVDMMQFSSPEHTQLTTCTVTGLERECEGPAFCGHPSRLLPGYVHLGHPGHERQRDQ
jgi:hypothetical protein